MIFRLAWRNIWRNKRRTSITIASVLFAVLFASLMESIQKGAWNNMINNVVNFHTGYVQVHQKGYWAEQSLDLAFPYNGKQVLGKGIRRTLPRLESFALASTGSNTMGVMATGIDPQGEDAMTGVKSRLVKGRFLEPGDRSVVLGSGIAENLKLEVGDTLLMISQGYHGVNAAGKYPVKGILHYPSPDLNRLLVFFPLKEAQWFYGAEGMVTSLVFHLDGPKAIPGAVQHLQGVFPDPAFETMDWPALLPDLLEAKKLDGAGNIVLYIVLYLIIAFGLLGTVLMMMRERQYEFGLLIAIGMKRGLLGATVWVETILLGLIGAFLGILCCLPVVSYFKKYPLRFEGDYSALLDKWGFEPVFPAELSVRIFLAQALIVFLITLVLALLPLWKVHKIKPVKAMHG